MAGFADKERGSSNVSWGNVIAGAGITGGVLLAGTAIGGMMGVDVLDINESTSEFMRNQIGSGNTPQTIMDVIHQDPTALDLAKAARDNGLEIFVEKAQGYFSMASNVASTAVDWAIPDFMDPLKQVGKLWDAGKEISGVNLQNAIAQAETAVNALEASATETAINLPEASAEAIENARIDFSRDMTTIAALPLDDQAHMLKVVQLGYADIVNDFDWTKAEAAFQKLETLQETKGVTSDALTKAGDELTKAIKNLDGNLGIKNALLKMAENGASTEEALGLKEQLMNSVAKFDREAMLEIAQNYHDNLGGSQNAFYNATRTYGDFIADNAMLSTGVAAAGAGYAYKNSHDDALAYDAPVNYARMENVKMGFAAQEQTRALNALIAARQQAFSPEASGQEMV